MEQKLTVTQSHENQPRCLVCQKFFTPHFKVKARQKVCERLSCRTTWRKNQQALWRKANPNYFHGRYEDVKSWRQHHPDYQRQWRAKRKFHRQSQKQSPNAAYSHEIQSKLSRLKIETPLEKAFVLSEIQLQLTTEINSTLSQIVHVGA
jgi:hypothetical protein